MIVYEPLWKTMKEKKVSQYLLIKTYGISCGQLDRLKKISMCPLTRSAFSVLS